MFGIIGDGKSTFGNGMARSLGSNTQPFSEGFSGKACTKDPQVYVANDVVLVDNPGLADPRGDAMIIGQIVKKAKEIGHLNMLLMVVKAENSRLNTALLDALQLIVDSLGPDTLNKLYVVFTHASGRSEDELTKLTDEWREIIKKRLRRELTHLTHFAIESHPERIRYIGEEGVKRFHMDNAKVLSRILGNARLQGPCSTSDAKPGMYEGEKRIKDAEAETERQKNIAEEERRKCRKAEEELASARSAPSESEETRSSKEIDYVALSKLGGFMCAAYNSIKGNKEEKKNGDKAKERSMLSNLYEVAVKASFDNKDCNPGLSQHFERQQRNLEARAREISRPSDSSPSSSRPSYSSHSSYSSRSDSSRSSSSCSSRPGDSGSSSCCVQ